LVGNGRPVFIYSNIGERRCLVVNSGGATEEIKPYKYIEYETPITERSKLTFAVVPQKHVNHCRNMFLNQMINLQGTAERAIFWMIDGYVFGATMFSNTNRGGDFGEETIFDLSDFVLPSQYMRLSKLLIMAIKSKEIREWLESQFFKKFSRITTIVFTKKPMSSKYRGVFDLIKRDPKQNKLTYESHFENYTLKGCFSLWYQKHHKVLREE
jgi:hypothetical protein